MPGELTLLRTPSVRSLLSVISGGFSAEAGICCEDDQARLGTATLAAQSVHAFYPHITVTVGRGTAFLTSEQEGEESLRMIWRTALANEVLLQRGADRRAGVIAGLVE